MNGPKNNKLEYSWFVEGTKTKEIKYFYNSITDLVPNPEEQVIADSGSTHNLLKENILCTYKTQASHRIYARIINGTVKTNPHDVKIDLNYLSVKISDRYYEAKVHPDIK